MFGTLTVCCFCFDVLYRHQQGLQILNHLRKLAEKYKGSEVEVNFERLAKAQVETLQKQQEQETKKQVNIFKLFIQTT
jgi:hypothetical protein